MMKSQLTRARERLVELAQELDFGQIEGLVVRNGDPVFTPPPCVMREVRMHSDEPRTRQCASDFNLKPEVIHLLAEMTTLGTGIIDRIDVKHGLPFRIHIRQPMN